MKKIISLLLVLCTFSYVNSQDFDFYISSPTPIPDPLSFCMDEELTFTVDYQGWGHVQWYKSPVQPDLINWTNYDQWENIPNNDTTYTLVVDAETYFWVSVTEGWTTAYSDVYHITLKGETPTIINTDTLFCEGSTITLNATPDDLGSGKYRWFKDGAELPGEISATLDITDEGLYLVEALTNEVECPDIYYPSQAVAFKYIVPSVSGTYKQDLNRVTLETTQDYSGYQWYEADTYTGTLTQIAGATNYSYNANITASDKYYAVEIETADGCISMSERVLVNDILYSVPVIVEPTNNFACRNDIITLSLESSSYSSYQWYRDAASIWGATSSTYDVDETGEYTVEVTTELDPNTVLVSNAVNLTFAELPKIIVKDNASLCPGASVTLQAQNGYSGPVGGYDTYQWYINDVNDFASAIAISGGTDFEIDINVPTESRYYFVETSINSCNDVSYGKKIEEFSLSSPYISASPWDKKICMGDTVLLKTYSSDVTFQWYFNGDTIGNATQNEYNATEVGYYNLEITSTLCPNAPSVMRDDSVVISYKVSPTFYVDPEGQMYGGDPNHRIFCAGDTISLDVDNATSYSNWQWMGKLYSPSSNSDEWEDIAGANDSIFGFINGENDKLHYKVRVDSIMGAGEVCTGISEYKTIDGWVFQSPVIASYNNSELCEDGDSTLLHLGMQGTWERFEWYREGVLIPDSDNDTLYAKKEGEHVLVAYPELCPNIPHSSGVGPHVKFMPEATVMENDTCIWAMPHMGYYEFQWFFDGVAINPDTLQTPWIIKKDQMPCGLYTVEVTNPANCVRNSEPYEWRNPAQEITVDAEICDGESYFVGGEWQTESGSYFDYFIAANGCDSVIETNLVVNKPEVDLGEDQVVNWTITLDAGDGFESYLWNTGETTQTITIEPSIGQGEHEYSVTVTDDNDCNNSDTVLITIDPSISIDKYGIGNLQVQLYPNPSRGVFNLEIANNSSKLLVDVLTIEGKIIMHREYEQLGSIKDKYDLTNLEGGWYIVRLQSRDEIKMKKFLITY